MTKSQPVVILGICPRSGTNFLYNILQQHPDCVASPREGQDSLLYGIHHIQSYIGHTQKYWKPHWGQSESDLRESIGNGIQQYLTPKEETVAGHFVTKTPHTYNIEHFFDFFPSTKLIVILRSGPDAIESGVRSFKWNLDDSFRMYADSALRILKFAKKNRDNPNFHMVKYEDLLVKESGALKELLIFCGLDLKKFDFDLIDDMPVYGSSTTQEDSDSGDVHWSPVAKSIDFKPSERSAGWSRLKHWRFNYISGKYALKLGYGLQYQEKTSAFYLFNYWKDIEYFLFRVIRKSGLRPKSK